MKVSLVLEILCRPKASFRCLSSPNMIVSQNKLTVRLSTVECELRSTATEGGLSLRAKQSIVNASHSSLLLYHPVPECARCIMKHRVI